MARSRTLGEDFTFVNPVVKYLLFLFNMLFWVSHSLSLSLGNRAVDVFLFPHLYWRAPYLGLRARVFEQAASLQLSNLSGAGMSTVSLNQ